MRDEKKGLLRVLPAYLFLIQFLLATYNLWVHKTPSNPPVFFSSCRGHMWPVLESNVLIIVFHLHLHLNLSSSDSEQVMNLSFCICKKMGIAASTLQSAYEHLS